MLSQFPQGSSTDEENWSSGGVEEVDYGPAGVPETRASSLQGGQTDVGREMEKGLYLGPSEGVQKEEVAIKTGERTVP